MITLRKMHAGDLPVFKKWLAAPHVAKWFTDPQDWLAEAEDRDGRFGRDSPAAADEIFVDHQIAHDQNFCLREFSDDLFIVGRNAFYAAPDYAL